MITKIHSSHYLKTVKNEVVRNQAHKAIEDLAQLSIVKALLKSKKHDKNYMNSEY